jgi:diaminopropionate ammonia-lyase
VAVPVGVGSLAEAVVRHYQRPGIAHPSVLSVEPHNAGCVRASLSAAHAITVATAPTVMAGLNCGTVSRSAWPVLRAGCDAAVAVSDQDALRAVADLGELGVSSGPSRSFRDKLILVLFALVRVYAWPGWVYYPCQRLGA